MTCFDLTDLTLGAAAERRVVIKTFELRWQVFMAGVISAVASLPLVGLVSLVFGPPGILALPVMVLLGVWLFTMRQASGLKLQNWRGVAASVQFRSGQVKLCGEPFDPHMSYVSSCVVRTLPVRGNPASRQEVW